MLPCLGICFLTGGAFHRNKDDSNCQSSLWPRPTARCSPWPRGGGWHLWEGWALRSSNGTLQLHPLQRSKPSHASQSGCNWSFRTSRLLAQAISMWTSKCQPLLLLSLTDGQQLVAGANPMTAKWYWLTPSSKSRHWPRPRLEGTKSRVCHCIRGTGNKWEMTILNKMLILRDFLEIMYIALLWWMTPVSPSHGMPNVQSQKADTYPWSKADRNKKQKPNNSFDKERMD